MPIAATDFFLGLAWKKVVTGEKVAQPFREAIHESIAKGCRAPKLIGLLANTDAPSRAYAEWTERACKAVGILYELRVVLGAEGSSTIEDAILEANDDNSIDGIMVYVS